MKYRLLEFHRKVPWRTLQLGINIATIVTGFCTFLPLSYVSMYFHWQCPLHAYVRLLSVNESTIYVDRQKTVWGLNTECMFSTYAPVTACIHAFIWCWYFLLMKAQLKAEHQEFPMLVFSSIFHSVVLVVLFVSSSILSTGFNVWCFYLRRAVTLHGRSFTCADTQDLMWPNVFEGNEKHAIYDFLRTSQISSWLQTLTVLCQTLVSGYKLYMWIVATTGGYLDLRKCGQSSSVTGTNEEVDLIDDNDNSSLVYSSGSEHFRYLSETERNLDAPKSNGSPSFHSATFDSGNMSDDNDNRSSLYQTPSETLATVVDVDVHIPLVSYSKDVAKDIV